MIIFGGPQVPDRTEGFFNKYPFIDIIVHGEGEYIIENIFSAYLKDKDFSEVKGIETKDFRTPPNPRIKDITSLASPYLTNVILDLVEKVDGIKYQASWETNRGCPYQCTFCDWGSLTNTKMTNSAEEKLFKEIEWFGDNKIIYIYCCDANFGIYADRDFRLASKLKEVALKTGYPKGLRTSWANLHQKKSSPLQRSYKLED